MVDDLHPEAAEALERHRQFGLSSLRSMGLRRLRWLERAYNWVRNRDPPPVGRVVDRTIPGPDDADVPVRLYRPAGGGPFPTVVFFHGGGFVLGSLESHDLLCRHLTRESGCVVLSVDYRLAPEHPFPAAVEDAYAAVEWAAANPDALAGDGRLALVGDSAGGNLAAVCSLAAAERGGPDVDYQYLLYPGVGIEPDQESVREHAGKVLSVDDLEWFRECYYGSWVHERNPYADPTNADDLSGVAPATVLTAGHDPLRDGGRRYADQLDADGVPTRHVEFEDVIHGFATMLAMPDLERAHDAVADVAADLRGVFRGE